MPDDRAFCLEADDARLLARELLRAVEEANDHGTRMPIVEIFLPGTIWVKPHPNSAEQASHEHNNICDGCTTAECPANCDGPGRN